jgi:hypothetical protein
VTSPGEHLNNRFELVRHLGRGTMGSVWEAFDTRLERTVAVKKLHLGDFGDEDPQTRRKRMRREAIALAQLNHPVIVAVHDLIYAGRDEVPWIVMSFAPGRTLTEIVKAQGDARLSEREIAGIVLAVLDGLRACHACDIYHRDVKPANIVLGQDGSVRVVDFSIARMAGEVPLTEYGRIAGTPEFLAPELLDGEPAGPGTDLWALGVTLYYALTGKTPFWAETDTAMCMAIKYRNPPVPRAGGQLANLVLQMLRKQPNDRPSADTIANTLRGVAALPDLPDRLDPPDLVGRFDRFDRQADRTVLDPIRWEQPAGQREQAPLARQERRPTALAGLPVLTQADVVANLPTDRAAGELVELTYQDAARVINRCDDVLGGNLLSAIAINEAVTARKILQMLLPSRQGPLADHMSSIALAAVLAIPPSEEAVRIVDHAELATLVGAVAEMPPVQAAPVVLALDVGRCADVLRRIAPERVADIMRNVFSASLRNELVDRLPEHLRNAVRRHLSR